MRAFLSMMAFLMIVPLPMPMGIWPLANSSSRCSSVCGTSGKLSGKAGKLGGKRGELSGNSRKMTRADRKLSGGGGSSAKRPQSSAKVLRSKAGDSGRVTETAEVSVLRLNQEEKSSMLTSPGKGTGSRLCYWMTAFLLKPSPAWCAAWKGDDSSRLLYGRLVQLRARAIHS